MRYRRWNLRGVSPFPPGVWWLLIANSALFILELVFPRGLIRLFGLNPSAFWTHHQVWTPVTYMFLHGGFLHLFFNMLVLLMFGSRLEEFWGTQFFLKYYFITGIGAGLSNVLFTPNAPWTIIGASGAMFGLLAAYGLLFPNNIIFFYFIIPIKAKYLVILFGIFEFFASLRPGADPVAHLAHLGGMIIGVMYLLHYKIVRR
ncbi:MAG: rhomboid family intramembrane serine protease, partial [bacterium]